MDLLVLRYVRKYLLDISHHTQTEELLLVLRSPSLPLVTHDTYSIHIHNTKPFVETRLLPFHTARSRTVYGVTHPFCTLQR